MGWLNRRFLARCEQNFYPKKKTGYQCRCIKRLNSDFTFIKSKSMTLRLLFISVVLVSYAFGQTFQADLVITNANIHTMDAKRTIARSIAVSGGKIIAIGSDADTKPLIGPNTRVIDAGGKLVIPGFNDAHVHLLETGASLSSVDLRSSKTPQEFVQRIKDFVAKQPKGRWILGGEWDHENWTPNNLPTAAMIDAVTPDNPVFVSRLDGHMALANSVAMRTGLGR